MKNLAKHKMKSLAIFLIAISFLISNFLYAMNNRRAQSEFFSDSLSFLLYEENAPNFIAKLEKFNKTHRDISIAYIDEKRNVISNPSDIPLKAIRSINLSEGMVTRTYKYKPALAIDMYYSLKGENTLILSARNNLDFYLSPALLLAHLLLLLASLATINKRVEEDVDRYISGLSFENSDKVFLSSDYDEIRSFVKTYVDKINELNEEAIYLNNRINEFINVTSNMKEGFIVFDGDGNIELINNSAKRYLGVSEDTNLKNLIDDKEYTLALREARILKRIKNLDINIDGNYLRIFIDPLSSNKKRSFAMIIIDNTEDVKAEQMRREFSANVTHELKSPLTSINGYAELIAAGIAKEDDVQKFAEIIYNEGNRLLEIIDDILKISRLDEKNYEKDFVEVDVAEVVTSTIEKYEHLAEKKQLNVFNYVKPYRIKTSKSLFHDLVSNIYENAIKYNKFGGTISVRFELGENNYYLIISDTGIGISATDTKRIFERFYVVDKSRKRNQKSTGLGLSIVKHIAAYLGYDIKVRSKLGEGTSFIIEIPLGLDREI